jgi:hypothetical protein
MKIILKFLVYFGFSFILVFFIEDFNFLIIPFFSIIIDLLLIFGLFPIHLFLLNAFLKMDVDIRLFDFGLPLSDEETQFIVELVDQLENIEELWALGLVGA